MNALHLPEIQDSADILAFFLGLREMGLVFHPDTPFDDYVEISSNERRRTFTDAEAKLLDKKLEECFNYCDDRGLDLYEIANTMDGFEEFQKSKLVFYDEPVRLYTYAFGYSVEEKGPRDFATIRHGVEYRDADLRVVEMYLYSSLSEDIKADYTAIARGQVVENS